MKILLINNSGLIKKEQNDDLYIESKTGLFAKDLNSFEENKVCLYGQYLHEKSTISVFPIKGNNLSYIAYPRRKSKILNYLYLYFHSICAIYHSDFVYIFYPNALKYMGIISFCLRRKYGLYIRGMEDLNSLSSKILYRKASIILTVSEGFNQIISPYTKAKLDTIRPMIPWSLKDLVPLKPLYKKNHYKILYLGRLAKEKGLKELLLSFSTLIRKGYSLDLIIIGEGEFKDDCISLIEKLSLEKYIFMEGGVYDLNKIKEYYLKADLFVLPSYHEGFPRTLYEAMIFGTPIVTTLVGGIPSLMENDVNCKAVKAKSVHSLTSVLLECINNYDQMEKIAFNARDTIIRYLSAKKMSHSEHLNYFLNKILEK